MFTYKLNGKPLNLTLFKLTDNDVKFLKEVKTNLTFNNDRETFNNEGLFSTEIFGNLGSEDRFNRFGYINLVYEFLNPRVYIELISINSLYRKIVNRETYAIWNDKINDFEETTPDNGRTGYIFFISKINKIEFKSNGSKERDKKIEFIEKYRKNKMLFTKYVPVLPAGYREISIDNNNRLQMDASNDIYIELINRIKTIKNIPNNKDYLDSVSLTFLKIQELLVELYKYFINLCDGKNAFIQGKWVKRTILNGTANVFTAYKIKPRDPLNLSEEITSNHTVIGLFQYAKGIIDLTMNAINTVILDRIFTSSDTRVMLYNKDYKKELIELDFDTYSDWTTEKGLEITINKLSNNSGANEEIIIDNYYLALVYKKDGYVSLIMNRDTFTEEDKKYIKPITYGELIYLALAYTDRLNKYPGLLTRYPITGEGSIYPSLTMVKTTIPEQDAILLELDSIDKNDKIRKVLYYPKIGKEWYFSMAPDSSRLAGLGGDYDGDKGSYNIIYTEEAVKEIKELLNSSRYYISAEGKILYSIQTDIDEFVFRTLTRH